MRGGFSQIEVQSHIPPRAEPSPEPSWRLPRAAGSRGAAVRGCPARGPWWSHANGGGCGARALCPQPLSPAGPGTRRRGDSGGGGERQEGGSVLALHPHGRVTRVSVTPSGVAASWVLSQQPFSLLLVFRKPWLGHRVPRLLSLAGWRPGLRGCGSPSSLALCLLRGVSLRRGPDPSSKATLWVKARHEGALPPPCIVRKDPRVPHTARRGA